MVNAWLQHFEAPVALSPENLATVTSTHDAADGAYARLDAIAEKLQRDGAPPDYLELHVVDTERHPVARPGVQ